MAIAPQIDLEIDKVSGSVIALRSIRRAFWDRLRERFGDRSRSFDRDQNDRSGSIGFAIGTIDTVIVAAPEMNGVSPPSAPVHVLTRAVPNGGCSAGGCSGHAPADDRFGGVMPPRPPWRQGDPSIASGALQMQCLQIPPASMPRHRAFLSKKTWARLGQTRWSVHQGIALQTAAVNPRSRRLIEGCSIWGNPTLVALDNTDPHNLGAVVRSAEAMGAHGGIQRRSGVDGFSAKVQAEPRTSAGGACGEPQPVLESSRMRVTGWWVLKGM